MKSLVHTTRFTRGLLPHWEIEHGRYFVTVRCHDSLPRNALIRIGEIHRTLQSIDSASPQFAQLQRQLFQTLEKYLDAGAGECPLRDPRAAGILVNAFGDLAFAGFSVPHFSIMPNHWHALLTSIDGHSSDLHAAMTNLKGRAARAINLALRRTRPLWQREWFDRWIRDDAEWERCVAYIRNNPVKAGFVQQWADHPWSR